MLLFFWAEGIGAWGVGGVHNHKGEGCSKAEPWMEQGGEGDRLSEREVCFLNPVQLKLF